MTGQYAYLAWIGSTFTAICTLGIPNALTKFTAEYSERDRSKITQQIASRLLLGTAIIGVLAALVLCGMTVLHWLPLNAKRYYFYLIALALPLNIIATSVAGLLKGHRRYAALMWANIIASPVTFIVVLLVLHYKPVLIGLVIYYILTALILLISYVIASSPTIKISFGAMPIGVWRPILKYIAVVSGVILLDQVVWDRSEVIFLGRYARPEQVAYYSLAYTFTSNAMTLGPGSIIGALLPHIAGLQGAEDITAIRATYQSATRYVGIIVGVLVAGGIALAIPLIHTLFGDRYVHMTPVFRLLIFSAGCEVIAGVASTVMYGMTRQSYLLKIGLGLSILNLSLDFLIIPRYGAIGAAIANGSAQLIGGVATIYLLARRVGLGFPSRAYIKIVAISIFSCLVVLALVHSYGGQGVLRLLAFGLLFVVLFSLLTYTSKLVRLDEFPFLDRFRGDRGGG